MGADVKSKWERGGRHKAGFLENVAARVEANLSVPLHTHKITHK